MSRDVPPSAAKSAAILDPEQHARYQKVLAFLEQQAGPVQRARAGSEYA